ncbi:hypothetical protein [Kitasatospora griseola]|uniref:hypothetical protein n=1 Tax=Kitasatospora griseola TaxID=2064 RepID=UPI003659550C
MDVPALLQQLHQPFRGGVPSVTRRVGAQLVDALVPGQQLGQLVVAVGRGETPTREQGDRFVHAALPLADRGEQAERGVGVETVAAPREVRAPVGVDPGGEQFGGFLVAVGDVDRGVGDGRLADVRQQQVERLCGSAVAGQQTGVVLQCVRVSEGRAGPDGLDRRVDPSPVLQQFGQRHDRRPPARRGVRGEDLDRLGQAAPFGEQPGPGLRAEPLAAPRPVRHHGGMTVCQQAGDQFRRDAAGDRSGPVLKIIGVHGPHRSAGHRHRTGPATPAWC